MNRVAMPQKNKKYFLAASIGLWFLATLFYEHQCFMRVLPNSLRHVWRDQFAVNREDLSILVASFFYSYLIWQPIAGILVSRSQRRIFIFLIVAIVNLLGMIILYFSYTQWEIIISQILLGSSAGFAVVLAIFWGRQLFPQNKKALLVGIIYAFGGIGIFLAGFPYKSLSSIYGWRQALMISITAESLLIIGIFIYHLKYVEKAKDASIRTPWKSTLSSVVLSINSKQVWYPILYGCFQALPFTAFISVWLVPFIQLELHTHALFTYAATATVYSGYVVGVLLLGYIASKIQQKKVLFFASAAGFLLSLILIYANNLSVITTYSILFLFGIMLGSISISTSAACDNFSSDKVPIGAGLSTIFNNLGGTVCLVFVGFALHFEIVTKHQQPLHAYHLILPIIPLSLVIATILSLLIKTNHTRTE